MRIANCAKVILPIVFGQLLLLAGTAEAGTVRKIRDVGPDDNRMVLVLVGDGYTAAEEDKFWSDAEATVVAMLNASPYREYAGYINVYADFVVSNESGADRPAPCFSPEVFRDTAFDGKYCTANTQRLATVNNSKVFAEVNQVVPQWDLIGAIMNDDTYGGSGGSILTFSTHSAAGELFLHEAGHTFARLTDEYETAFVPQKIDPEPNVDLDFLFDDVKWNVWIEAATPLPTPESVDLIGAYEGARYHSTGIFRPVINCKMRSLNRPFGAICKEGHVQRIYQFVEPIDGATPDPAVTVEFDACSGEVTFVLDVLEPDPQTLVAEWFLDGGVLLGETGFQLTLTAAELSQPTHEVFVLVQDATPLVRRIYWDDMSDTRSWTLARSVPASDLDKDGIDDSCDPDIDGDDVLNEMDCAPWNGAVSADPEEVSLVFVRKGTAETTLLAWTDILGPLGDPAEGDYVVTAGWLSDLHTDQGFQSACGIAGDRSPSLEDSRTVPAGALGIYFLLQARNECGYGSIGSSEGVPDLRTGLDWTALPACP